MSRSCSIALTGLSPTERVLIEGALFPPSGSPISGVFLEHDLAQAQLIIASADDSAAVAALKARDLPARVLLLGSSDRGTGWPVVSRPLRLHAVLEAIRRLLGPSAGAPVREVEPKPAPAVRGWVQRFASGPAGFADTQPYQPQDLDGADDFGVTRQLDSPAEDFGVTRQLETARSTAGFPTLPRGLPGTDKDAFQSTQQFSHSVPSVAPSDWESEVAEWERTQTVKTAITRPLAPLTPPDPDDAGVAGPPDPPSPKPGAAASPLPEPGAMASVAAPDATQDRILVVGLPGNAASGLIKTLRHAGFTVDFADGAQAARDLMGQRPFRFVILIEVSLGSQAIPLCRTLQEARGLSPADLRVLIVASHRGLLSRIRAQFAGCSAWLTIPLKQAALIQYLRRNGSGSLKI
jgi:CheY-like chemotaxis protein